MGFNPAKARSVGRGGGAVQPEAPPFSKQKNDKAHCFGPAQELMRLGYVQGKVKRSTWKPVITKS